MHAWMVYMESVERAAGGGALGCRVPLCALRGWGAGRGGTGRMRRGRGEQEGHGVPLCARGTEGRWGM